MKRLFILIICCIIGIFSLAETTEIYAEDIALSISGTGSINSPYLIHNNEELLYAVENLDAESVCFSIQNDLEVSGTIFSSCKGVWNGNFNTIIGDSLFCRSNTGVLKNIIYKVEDTITDKASVFCGANSGTIEGCGIIGSVLYKSNSVGIVTQYNYGRIIQCYAIGNATSTYGVKATTTYAGGISGGGEYWNGSYSGEISNCYAVAKASVPSDITGVGGSDIMAPISPVGNVNNCYYNFECFGESTKTNKYSLTDSEMKSSEFVDTLNENPCLTDAVWIQDVNNENGGYPILASCLDTRITVSKADIIIDGTENVTLASSLPGCDIYYTIDGSRPSNLSTLYSEPIEISETVTITAVAIKGNSCSNTYKFEFAKLSGEGTQENPYVITKEAELNAIRERPDNFFVLGNDIVLENAWDSIEEFSGELDGAGYTIDGLVNRHTSEMGGAGFVITNSGTIKNVTMNANMHKQYSDSEISYGVGGIAAVNNGVIQNANVKGKISSYGYEIVGAVCATNEGVVANCTASGEVYVKAQNPIVGGLIGYDKGEIYASSANSYVHVNSAAQEPFVGGLVGSRYTTSTMRCCYSEGTVYADNNYWYVVVGGLVGENEKGDISDCYSKAVVKGHTYGASTASKIGEFVGIIGGRWDEKCNILCCYAVDSTYYPFIGEEKNNVTESKCGVDYFDEWDYLTVWDMDENINNGNPYFNFRKVTDISIGMEIVECKQYDDIMLTVTAVNEEGDTKVITDYTLIGLDTSACGEKIFTISYKEFTKDFKLIVTTDIAYTSESDFEFSNATINKYIGNDTYVIIPPKIGGAAVKFIDAEAFAYNDSIVSVTIPHSVRTIAEGAFASCENLQIIAVDEGNTYFSSVDGVLFNYDKTQLIAYPNIRQTSYIIPETVEWIRGKAFAGNIFLKKVIIPESVIDIEPEAFMGCISLIDITLPSSINFLFSDTFSGCSMLKDIYIEKSPNMWEGDFYYRTTESSGAELHCKYVLSDSDFFQAEDAVGIWFCRPTGSDVDYVIFPDKIDGNLLNDVYIYEFPYFNKIILSGDFPYDISQFYELERLELGINTNYIYGLEYVWGSLIEIDVPKENNTFSSCDGVLFNKDKTALIKYPPSMEQIFYKIPYGITKIEYGAFNGCSNLTSIEIPASVTSIDFNAFDCENLTDVYYDGTKEDWDKIAINSYNSILNAEIHYSHKGMPINDLYDTGDKIFVNVSLSNAENINSATAILIGLKENGEYSEADLQPVTSNEKNAILAISSDDINNVKILLWDDFNTLKPLCDFKKISVLNK